MLRRMNKLIALLLLLLSVTGCWSRRELNDLSVTVAIGLDKIGDEYQIAAQIVNPNEVTSKKGGSVRGAPVFTFKEKAVTIFEAIRKLTKIVPRQMYFSHLRMLVIGEELAKEGVAKPFDFLSRDHEFRTDFFIAVARGVPAEKILEIYTVPQEPIPANKMFKNIQTSNKFWAATGKMTIDQMITDMMSEGKQPVVTGVRTIGDASNEIAGRDGNARRIDPVAALEFSGLAVFRKDKLIGWLNPEESKAYNYILGEVKQTVERVACPGGGNLSLQIMNAKSEVRGKVANGRPAASVKLQLEGNVGDVECHLDLTALSTFDELEERTERKLRKQIEGTIRIVQRKYVTDIFGFGEAVHRNAPRAWSGMKKDWESAFARMPVSVDVEVKIKNKGTVSESLVDKLKE